MNWDSAAIPVVPPPPLETVPELNLPAVCLFYFTLISRVFNMFTVGWDSGVGTRDYQSNVTVANLTNIEALHHGVQVMVLDSKGHLAVNTKQFVTLSLEATPDSSSHRWGRKGRLTGVTRVQASAGVASFGRFGISAAGSYHFVACLTGTSTTPITIADTVNCTRSSVFHVVAGTVAKMAILKQPNATEVVSMYDTVSKNAVFTNKQGPINVTWEDSLGNRGSPERVVRIRSGLLLMNVTCSRVGGQQQIQVATVQEAWSAGRGWVAFWNLGPLRDGINKAFGAGAASVQDGYSCFGRIGASRAVTGRNRTEPVIQTNTWRVVA
jgi:hypothetical protein